MKKIALIGSAPSSVRLAPYNNPEWEIWGCSPGAWASLSEIKAKAHVWFELHRWEPGQPWLSPEYCKYLAEFDGPVVMSKKSDTIPNATELDVNYLVQKYGPYFFTSSLSWMFALAIEQGATTIGLWGVDMAATEEYGYQRAGCQYFATLARAMGIEVGVPPESDLLRPAPLYGVCENSHNWIKSTARKRELTTRLNTATQTLNQAQQEMQFVRGALDDLGWHEQTWFGHIDTAGPGYVEPPHVPTMAPIPFSDQTHETIVQPPKKPTKKRKKKATKKVSNEPTG